MRLFYKNIFIVIIFLPFSISALAASSPNYDLNQTVINAFGNTYSGSGKKLHDSAGEGIVGQIFSATYSIQSGFFNTYYMLPLSPTPTPTITITATPTYTPTVIRGFGGEIMHKDWVYAAPNPIRGVIGKIYFNLAMPAEVELKIFTPQNQFVLSRHWDQLPAGTNMWQWNAANMANGVYLLYIKARNNEGKTTVIIKKIALIK
ncbi:hypothetical protein KAR34_10120 [bacterium]|nr:hypothetical protein [bacterium]